jgi:predicted nucleic acid-binding protein
VRQRLLIDTGPIVAILSARDQHHELCIDELAQLHPPLITCWPVVTESQWLLRDDSAAVDGLFRAFATGLFALAPVDEAAMPWLQAFVNRYQKLKPDLADGTLVYLAEREGIHTIFTLDHRDFSIFRYSKNRRLKLVPEGPIT